MHCELLCGSEKVRGPLPYKPNMLAKVFARLGLKFPPLPQTLSTPLADLSNTHTLYPVTVNKPPASRQEDSVLASRVVDTNAITYTYITVPRNYAALRLQLKERISGRHALYELNYATFNSIAIKADLEARINAAEIVDSFQKGKINSIKWRGKNGKISVEDVETMQAIYDTIFRYLHIGFAAKEIAEDTVDTASDAELVLLDPIAVFDATVATLDSTM